MTAKYIESVGRVCAVDASGKIICLCTCTACPGSPCPVHNMAWDGDRLRPETFPTYEQWKKRWISEEIRVNPLLKEEA